MVREAADLAKKRKVDMIARQERRVSQLESLRALVRKKEEEVSCLCAAVICVVPDSWLPSFVPCRRIGEPTKYPATIMFDDMKGYKRVFFGLLCIASSQGNHA